jgi:hypothetical protein
VEFDATTVAAIRQKDAPDLALNGRTRQLLQVDVLKHNRLWFMGDLSSRDSRLEEWWLARHYREIESHSFGTGSGNVRLTLYALSETHNAEPIVARFTIGDHWRVKQASVVSCPYPNRWLAGDTVLLQLDWRPLRPAPLNCPIGLYLVDGNGVVRAWHDTPPLRASHPASNWQEGEFCKELYSLALPDDVEPGGYRLAVALHDRKTLERMSVEDSDGTSMPDNLIVLTSLEIVDRDSPR